jgi:hypothetical protein
MYSCALSRVGKGERSSKSDVVATGGVYLFVDVPTLVWHVLCQRHACENVLYVTEAFAVGWRSIVAAY